MITPHCAIRFLSCVPNEDHCGSRSEPRPRAKLCSAASCYMYYGRRDSATLPRTLKKNGESRSPAGDNTVKHAEHSPEGIAPEGTGVLARIADGDLSNLQL